MTLIWKRKKLRIFIFIASRWMNRRNVSIKLFVVNFSFQRIGYIFKLITAEGKNNFWFFSLVTKYLSIMDITYECTYLHEYFLLHKTIGIWHLASDEKFVLSHALTTFWNKINFGKFCFLIKTLFTNRDNGTLSK